MGIHDSSYRLSHMTIALAVGFSTAVMPCETSAQTVATPVGVEEGGEAVAGRSQGNDGSRSIDSAAEIFQAELVHSGSGCLSSEIEEICRPIGVCHVFARIAKGRSVGDSEKSAAFKIASTVVYPGNEISIRLVVSSLGKGDSTREERAIAVAQLLESARPLDLLRKHSTQIETAIFYPKSPEETMLLSLIDLSEEARSALLDGSETSLEARALLGCVDSQRELVRLFDVCVETCEYDSFGEVFRSSELDRSARALIALDSQDARSSLSIALGSTRVMGRGGTGSVSFFVLDALKKEYPNDPILARLYDHMYVSEDDFLGTFHQSYLYELQRHLASKYNLNTTLGMRFFYRGPKIRSTCKPLSTNTD